jgi:hypothetical protein
MQQKIETIPFAFYCSRKPRQVMTLSLSVVVLWKQKRMYFALASLCNVTSRNYPNCYSSFKGDKASNDTVTFLGSFVSTSGAVVLALSSLAMQPKIGTILV